MKISERFCLNKSQYELDFIDIDTDTDTPLFLDPYFISKGDFPFAEAARRSLCSYFEFLLALLSGKRIKEAEELFSYLGETNDVCLGLSKGKPRGHGMGPEDAKHIFKQLLESKALRSGIMADIEDFRVFVPNVDRDKVSDMTANIIKKHLLAYTKEQCNLHGIQLTPNVPSGMYWDADTMEWRNEYTERLIIDNTPILLVPKRIVSFSDKYTTSEYRTHFVLNFLQNEHLRLQSPLVQKRKNGRRFVTKKDIRKTENGLDKDYLATFTKKHPHVFGDFRRATISKIKSVPGGVLDEIDISDVCIHISKKLSEVPPGRADASRYHNIIIGALELLCYPNLSKPIKEDEIHDGRKRIDITFENSSEKGFFFELPSKTPSIPCNFVMVECKNYVGEVANPELDQLAGRFSPRRGRFGILACRSLDENDGFLKRCADTFDDDRGLIIPITDDDIIKALAQYPEKGPDAIEEILRSRHRVIAFSK